MPEEFLQKLKLISELSKEKKDQLLRFLSKVLPDFKKPKDQELKEILKAPLVLMELTDIMEFVIILYINFYNRKLSQEEFIKKIIEPSIKSSEIEVELDKNLRDFIKKLLSMDKTVGVFAKSIDLSSEDVNHVINERIITDLRYIFYSNLSSLPDYGIIQHKLKITYLGNNGSKEKYFSFNLEELKTFKNIIERAIKKDSTLRNMSEDNNITILEVVGDFLDE